MLPSRGCDTPARKIHLVCCRRPGGFGIVRRHSIQHTSIAASRIPGAVQGGRERVEGAPFSFSAARWRREILRTYNERNVAWARRRIKEGNIRELSTLREGWDAFEREETVLLRGLSLAEGVRQWLLLQRAFEAQLNETADIFARERWAALADLQARLRRVQA